MKVIPNHKKQSGQVLVMSLLFLIVSITLVQMLFGVGLINNEKERLINAADGAAYSAGTYFARHLNFLAYTNRVMLANHVAVGHYISYVSWIRYAHDSIDKLDRLAGFFPSGKLITRSAEKIIRSKKILSEKVSAGIVNLSDQINSTIENAQLRSQETMNGVLSISTLLDVKIMDKVAKSYHPSIRVNHKEDVLNVRPTWIREQILTDMADTLQYVTRYRAGSDNGKIYKIIKNAYREDDHWIRGNRGWKLAVGKIGIYKEGQTKSTDNNSKLGWEADDSLEIKRPSLFGKKSRTLASSHASVNEFKKNYNGISRYYDRRYMNNNSIKMSALATAEPESVGHNGESKKLWALSRVEIVYQIPKWSEKAEQVVAYSSLYNPYWQVRLTKNTI